MHPHGQLRKHTDSEDCLFPQYDKEWQQQFSTFFDSKGSRDFLCNNLEKSL